MWGERLYFASAGAGRTVPNSSTTQIITYMEAKKKWGKKGKIGS